MTPQRAPALRSRLRAARPGFTLVELMIVTVILGILGILASGPLMKARERAAVTASQMEMRNIMLGIEMYVSFNHGALPTRFSDLASTGVNSHPDILVCTFKAVTDHRRLDDHVRVVLQHKASTIRIDARYPAKGSTINVQTKQQKDCRGVENR